MNNIYDMMKNGKSREEILKELEEAETALKNEAAAAEKKEKLGGYRIALISALSDYFTALGMDAADVEELTKSLDDLLIELNKEVVVGSPNTKVKMKVNDYKDFANLTNTLINFSKLW